MGFIPNCLEIFQSGKKTGDYHDDMNSKNYEFWLQSKLLPNLPPGSVVVADNAPYHNVQINKAPTSVSKKAEMQHWLADRGISFTAEMLKPELYHLIKLHKPKFVQYRFDRLFTENGPYHPDLNPIEMIWAVVKKDVANNNCKFNVGHVKELAENAFDKVSLEDWRKRCEHVTRIENEYLAKEAEIDIEVEKLIINPIP